MQRVVKYSSILSYILKPTSLLAQGFNRNKKAHEKLFKHMCNFGARSERRTEGISVSSCLDVEISNDQYRLLNPTPLYLIAGYIMEYYIGDRSLENLSQKRLNLFDGYISSYCSIINSPKRLCMIKQANELASVICDIETDRLGAK